jgi:hypothetical protein
MEPVKCKVLNVDGKRTIISKHVFTPHYLVGFLLLDIYFYVYVL